jgi:hypothetical protein
MYPVEVVDVSTKEGKKYQSTEEEQKLAFSLIPIGYTGEGVIHGVDELLDAREVEPHRDVPSTQCGHPG